jgi:hypothetical protein
LTKLPLLTQYWIAHGFSTIPENSDSFSESKFHEIADVTLDGILERLDVIEDAVDDADISLSVRLTYQILTKTLSIGSFITIVITSN